MVGVPAAGDSDAESNDAGAFDAFDWLLDGAARLTTPPKPPKRSDGAPVASEISGMAMTENA